MAAKEKMKTFFQEAASVLLKNGRHQELYQSKVKVFIGDQMTSGQKLHISFLRKRYFS